MELKRVEDYHDDDGAVFLCCFNMEDGKPAGEPFEVLFSSPISSDYEDRFTHFFKLDTNFAFEFFQDDGE